MKNIIEVKNISKLYKLGEISSNTIIDDFSNWWAARFGQGDGMLKSAREKKAHEKQFWALKDLSFQVKEGEILGIIGKNGAGKSTLLKILSRVTAPTSGSIKIHGRIASLLEVGTGFHPELSGRDNIYQNGAVLGMREAEIRSKFDEIVDFSGVEKFIDTPVKRYSSGMYVRLAFAVAAHLEPEILIIDEVLAVGDADFQKKCIRKMQDVSKGSGRTVLFVSHNLTAVQSLCTRAILLLNGKMETSGDVGAVIASYQNKYNTNISSNQLNVTIQNDIILHAMELTSIPERSDMLTRNEELSIITTLTILNEIEFYAAIILRTANGDVVLETASKMTQFEKGDYKITCSIPARFLNNETYTIQLNVTARGPRIIYYIEDALRFEIFETEASNDFYGKVAGIVRPDLDWRVTRNGL